MLLPLLLIGALIGEALYKLIAQPFGWETLQHHNDLSLMLGSSALIAGSMVATLLLVEMRENFQSDNGV